MTVLESLRQFWIGEFNKFGEGVLPFQCESSVMKIAWLDKYKNMPPFSTMPEEEKKETMKYVIDMFPDRSPEEKMEACHIIYTIGNSL
jgi:hypothetical protein